MESVGAGKRIEVAKRKRETQEKWREDSDRGRKQRNEISKERDCNVFVCSICGHFPACFKKIQIDKQTKDINKQTSLVWWHGIAVVVTCLITRAIKLS